MTGLSIVLIGSVANFNTGQPDEATRMIRVRIGGAEYDLADVSESWVNEQIGRRRSDGVPVCVQVIIRTSEINVMLSTPGCGNAGGDRPPNTQENEILGLWGQMHLDREDFTGGNMIAFLKRVRSYI